MKPETQRFQYFYALEKFSRAIETLATGEGDIRQRLQIIFHGDLAHIDLEHLPPQLQEDYHWIKQQITKYDEKYPGQRKRFESEEGRYDYCIPGKIEATLSRIRNSTGIKIAKKLFNIWDVLNSQFIDAK